MNILETIFLSLLLLIAYTYIGYGILLYVLAQLKILLFKKKAENNSIYEPSVTMLITAYNEKDHIVEKINNTFNLNYPKEKLQILFVTDGSDDGTEKLLHTYDSITVLHESKRLGKIEAMNKGIKHVKTPYVIFSDANAMLNPNAVKEIVKHYQNPKVGCVSGEKRILIKKKSSNEFGEGLYWKYESFLKKHDSILYSTTGAAGELFSVKTILYQPAEKDTLLDDFIISLRIVQKGYQIAYEPKAYAYESASVSIKEEMKRKVRISAGGIQSILRLKPLLNPFKYTIFTFQYISHRVLRWTLAPLALALSIPLNIFLVVQQPQNFIYAVTLAFQIFFYLLALWGWFFKNRQSKFTFIPFYFLFMNFCVFLGVYKFLTKKQSVFWERAQRS